MSDRISALKKMSTCLQVEIRWHLRKLRPLLRTFFYSLIDKEDIYELSGPRGTQDILPKDIRKWHRLEELIRQFCHVYNYDEIKIPFFEHTNVFKEGMIPVIW